MNVTFKENVSDVRNSKVVHVVYALKDFSLNVDDTDCPLCIIFIVLREYGFSLLEKPDKQYDVVLVP
jgi:UDP-N-acetyl-D-glucosamine/UDP-N-acetyl-D-galactosamine dehydrogenase